MNYLNTPYYSWNTDLLLFCSLIAFKLPYGWNDTAGSDHPDLFSLTGNPTYLFTWIYRLSFQAVANASVAVDTFFVLSGLLAAYVFLKDFEKRNTTLRQFLKGLPKLFSHRYIRWGLNTWFIYFFDSYLTCKKSEHCWLDQAWSILLFCWCREIEWYPYTKLYDGILKCII